MIETIATFSWYMIMLFHVVFFMLVMGFAYYLNGIIHSRIGYITYGAVLMTLSVYWLCVILY